MEAIPAVPRPFDFPAMFSDIAGGNKDAVDLCDAVLAWVHLLDDVVDGEKARLGVRVLSGTSLRAAFVFATNPFWQKHQFELWPILLNSAQAFMDSESGRHDARMNEVLKTQYQEFFFHVARLAGGWDHYVRIADTYRQAPA